MGDNIDINMTLWDSLVSFSKDGTTLTLEDLAEHHHLRHNQSKLENPKFRFSNRDAIVTLYVPFTPLFPLEIPSGFSVRFIFKPPELTKPYTERNTRILLVPLAVMAPTAPPRFILMICAPFTLTRISRPITNDASWRYTRPSPT